MRIFACLAAAAAVLTAPALAFQQRPPTEAELLLQNAPDEVWQEVDPENLLVIDLPSGPAIAELRPDFAPLHVERIKQLSRDGFYNGTIFHRVIDGFMAQGGDPTGTGTGGSTYPDLKGRFVTERGKLGNFIPVGRDDRASVIGFLGTMPIGAQTTALTEFLNTEAVGAWPLHCPEVLSMARAGDPDSANSQFFIMLADNRRSLDQQYTAWGRIIDGERNVRRINRGEPPERPTPILRMRVMSDLPAGEQKRVEVLRTDSETFKAWLQQTGNMTEDGFFPDACAVKVPVRIDDRIS
ncbi:peptidylprolyl isomerase [Parvularcula maris]|uniref:peptidylprolyl isomerase n=1 Tax=Parvularcula maris TaxID=2965077 RepID=A0A9X2RIY4_9PROT|nr:peptidylprolyl isomerase [Parvularcula maris]MCQ8185356.1 peptidylprolyl isomerase [Parvularcula maris]